MLKPNICHHPWFRSSCLYSNIHSISTFCWFFLPNVSQIFWLCSSHLPGSSPNANSQNFSPEFLFHNCSLFHLLFPCPSSKQSNLLNMSILPCLTDNTECPFIAKRADNKFLNVAWPLMTWPLPTSQTLSLSMLFTIKPYLKLQTSWIPPSF